MPAKTKANPFGCALVKLPTKPSDLIRLALRDLALVERSKIYYVDMGDWHEPDEEEERGVTCAVCFAGAVMARTFKAPINKPVVPGEMPYQSHNCKRLIALNDFRVGCIEAGLHVINRKLSRVYISEKYGSIFNKIENLSAFLDYEKDRGKFKRTMRKIARLLEKMGL